MENSVWLRGFVVKSLGAGVRVSPRPVKIQWICNISIGFPSHHCELDHMALSVQLCPRPPGLRARDGGTGDAYLKQDSC